MWLPTKHPARPLRREPWRSLAETPRIPAAVLPVLLIVLLTSLLAGCGYQFAAKEPSIFGDTRPTLRLTEVENPTMETWLPYTLRSAMRDEVNRRKLASWVDSAPSDYTMRIHIQQFTVRSAASDSKDNTLLYSATLAFEVIIYTASTNNVFWRSGEERLSRTYDSRSDELAGKEAAKLLVQRVCDRMRYTF